MLKKWILRLVKIVAAIVILFVVTEVANYSYKSVRMRFKTSPLVLKDTPQIWAHKGFHESAPANTLAAYRAAFEKGIKGIELDIHYDLPSSKFVISHNYPYEIPGGTLLYLEEVFSELNGKGYYWLDLKNLSNDNFDAIVLKMNELLDRYGLRSKVFIESYHYKEISRLSKLGFQTIYWISFDHKPGTLKHLLELHKMRATIIKSEFYAVSAEYKNMLNYPDDILNDFPIFLFTVDDKSSLERIFQNKHVKVVLTDSPEFF